MSMSGASRIGRKNFVPTFSGQIGNRVYPISMSDPSYPHERAPVLRLFGDHATRMATLLRIRPSLLVRIAYAPRRAIHSIGAFLFLAADAGRPDAEVAEILDVHDPRDLLLAAIPCAPPRLYRALDRAGDQVRGRSFYERLAILCAGPLADVLLSAGPLDDARLDRAETLLGMDPIVLTFGGIHARPMYQIEAIDVLVRFLRAHGAFHENDLHVPRYAGMNAILRRVQKAFDRVRAPSPPFAMPDPFRVIRTVGELRAAGVILKNCVRSMHEGGNDHWFRLAEGSTVYITCDAPSLLAAVICVGPDLWLLDGLYGPENTDVGADVAALLTDALQIAGVRLVRKKPARAMWMLSRTEGLADCEDAVDEAALVA
jgi:hypothetical protein